MTQVALPPVKLERIIQMQSLIVQAAFDLDAFMQTVVDNLQELTGAKGAVVELVEQDSMVYRATCGSMNPFVGMRLSQASSLSGLCVRTLEVLRCTDAEHDPRVDLPACRRVGVRSMVCTPLLHNRAPVGVLKVMSDKVDAFNDEDVHTLQLMADVLGAALGKQIAYDHLIKDKQQLSHQVERQAQETRTLQSERRDMLTVLAHEVRQPLNNASAALQSAAHLLTDAKEPSAAQRLSRARGVMGQVLANIDNTLAVAALLTRSGPADRADTDVDTLISLTLADFPDTERHRIMMERPSITRTVAMDMSLMRLALRNLLSNALAFSSSDKPVVLTLSDSDAPLALVFDVRDQGPGMDASLVPVLFEKGVRSTNPHNATGHGLGLHIVKRVMELHGGTAEMLHNSSRGVTMRLVLPLAPAD